MTDKMTIELDRHTAFIVSDALNYYRQAFCYDSEDRERAYANYITAVFNAIKKEQEGE